MTIYHFCSDKQSKSIFRDGVTIGAIMTQFLPLKIVSGYMWLTLDPDPKRQSWATSYIIPYSRTAWRFTIEIPDDKLGNLYDRKKLVEEFPGTDMLFDEWEGSENWRVYKGTIPRAWIRAVDRMEDA